LTNVDPLSLLVRMAATPGVKPPSHGATSTTLLSSLLATSARTDSGSSA